MLRRKLFMLVRSGHTLLLLWKAAKIRCGNNPRKSLHVLVEYFYMWTYNLDPSDGPSCLPKPLDSRLCSKVLLGGRGRIRAEMFFYGISALIFWKLRQIPERFTLWLCSAVGPSSVTPSFTGDQRCVHLYQDWIKLLSAETFLFLNNQVWSF